VDTKEFIKQKLREYYDKKGVVPPFEFDRREFGFGNDKKIDYRHFAFNTEAQLRQYFVTNVPLYASYSAAYYDFPEARPMEKKVFRGADLIFEFDADCDHDNIACSKCLDVAKQQSIRLIDDFLIPDFGFDRKEILVSFSGNRGYHIHVRSDSARQLNANARKQVADYIRGEGFTLAEHAKLDMTGWQGRIARDLYGIIEKGDAKALAAEGTTKPYAEKLFANKEYMLQNIRKGNWDVQQSFMRIRDKLAANRLLKLRLPIDSGVTMDISRLIRMPTTIHGGSSLLCCLVEKLDDFDPFVDAVVFTDRKIGVKPTKAIKQFSLREQTFGPFVEGVATELPEHAAMLMICKGAAVPA
jgi:DNA primase small subunit